MLSPYESIPFTVKEAWERRTTLDADRASTSYVADNGVRFRAADLLRLVVNCESPKRFELFHWRSLNLPRCLRHALEFVETHAEALEQRLNSPLTACSL